MDARQNKPVITLLGTAALVVGLMFLPGLAKPAALAQQPTTQPPNQRTVSVTGSGSVSVAPDIGIIVLGVQTQADTASEALTQNNQQMEDLMTALTGAGIAETDIRTRTVQLYPRYEPSPTPSDNQQEPVNALTGYNALNTVEVTVRDLDNLGELIDQAVAAGSNQIESIYFDVENQQEALDQARQAAFQDASRKARQLAQLAGAELGQVISVFESSSFPVPYQEQAFAMDQAASRVPISPGEQNVVLNVQVTWELQ